MDVGRQAGGAFLKREDVLVVPRRKACTYTVRRCLPLSLNSEEARLVSS